MLDGLISRASLESLAGLSAFRRGEEYLAVGAVGRLRATGDRVAAKVEGTTTYQVELRDDDGALAFDCNCPRAADGYFCKHGVALGLAWLDEHPVARKAGAASGREKRRDPWRDIKRHGQTTCAMRRGHESAWPETVGWNRLSPSSMSGAMELGLAN